MLRVLSLLPDSVVDGPGLRTVLFLAGCPHHCVGCHNPSSWDPAGGVAWTIDETVARIQAIGHRRLTISGGEPLLQAVALFRLLERLGQDYEILLYTGYMLEDIIKQLEWHPLLRQLDGLIDGPFVLSKLDRTTSFRGSTNQRLYNRQQLNERLD
ncbi:4Fe-4S single cluster domain-containing protein [uncultured Exiguobacterium sp.]|uniref:4Fe-4S single cluster domain-containing protein n=1 Tax=uncultured Exiguobacterium sp. TaxID=202669 RepID=UPI0025F4C583|nr:4Fe-4S single cluster domain-containing protein [uncultured Exiguobacterium sp.]